MENNYIETCLEISKVITALFAAGITIWKLFSRIKNSDNLFTKKSSLKLEDLQEGRTKNVLIDIEIAKLIKTKGLPYMEEATRDKIFCLHELVKYQMTYEQVASANSFIDIDNDNRYVINITKPDQNISNWITYLSLGICFLMFAFTYYIISFQNAIIKQEGLYLICQSIFLAFILNMFLKRSLPIRNAKTLINLSKHKDFVFSKAK